MKDIVAYVPNYTEWSPAIAVAASLAASLEGALTGVHVCAPPLVAMPSYEAPEVVAAIVENTRQQEDMAYAVRARFEAWAMQRGVRTARWQVAEGFVPEVLEHLGHWHDALVIDRDANPLWGPPPALGRVILSAQIPCIVLPPAADAVLKLDCIAVAWNGSPEAIRTVHSALALISRAKRVVVLEGSARPAFAEMGWKPQFDLHHYLENHGIHAERRPIPDDVDAGSALLESASDINADLLVMGAYGRTRFSEWVLGGATRHVLNHATVPVLMRH
ncbi:MAG: universal stress protein [Tahibacter sp.]